MYAKIENGEIVTINKLQDMFPNTSFPLPRPDEYEGWKKVIDNGGTNEEVKGDITEQDGEFIQTYVIDRDKLNDYLPAYRWKKEVGGFTLSNGMFIPTDDKTERRIIGARLKAEADNAYTIEDWTTDDGETTYTLTASDIITISDAFDAHVQKCFSAMVAVRASLADYDTIEELETAFDNAYNQGG